MDWRERNGIELVKLEFEFWGPDPHIVVQVGWGPVDLVEGLEFLHPGNRSKNHS